MTIGTAGELDVEHNDASDPDATLNGVTVTNDEHHRGHRGRADQCRDAAGRRRHFHHRRRHDDRHGGNSTLDSTSDTDNSGLQGHNAVLTWRRADPY